MNAGVRDTLVELCPTPWTAGGAPPSGPAKPGKSKVIPPPDNQSDRMIHPVIFRELQAMLGWRFTLDAAANDDGSNALVTDFCSKSRSFFKKDLAGHTLWMNPPFEDISTWLDRYTSQKHAHPESIRACIVVPSSYKRSQAGKHFWHGWKCLKFFEQGSELFFEPTGMGRLPMAGTPWGVHVMYDPYHTNIALGSFGNSLTMQFNALLAGVEVTALLDSGAEANFVPRCTAEENGLDIETGGYLATDSFA